MRVKKETYILRSHDLVLDDTPYILKVRDLPAHEKPREKMQQFGPGELTISELIAVILGTGTRKEEVLAMSRRIISEYGEKAIITETNPRHLAEVLSIPITKAQQIIAACEIGRRVYGSRQGKPIFIHTSGQAFAHLAHIGHLGKEQLRGLYLNSRHELVYEEIISVGTLTANIVHPREVFQPAMDRGAVAVIIAHNHPSGITTPTEADISVTVQLQAAGHILGIELLDHLIIAGESYESCLEVHRG